MLRYTHSIIIVGYVVAPILAIGIAIVWRRQFKLLGKLFAVASAAIAA